MPEDMPDRMPEDMPDRMPEDMSDRMPKDLPVTKCINVMVGITRSNLSFPHTLNSYDDNASQCKMWTKVTNQPTKNLKSVDMDMRIDGCRSTISPFSCI